MSKLEENQEKMRIRTQANNANLHTERGMKALEESMEADGTIGAVTLAADGEAFDGSARLEKLEELGLLDDAIYVRTDGTKPIIHIREDIPTADDPRARRLGVAANRVPQLNLNWNAALLAQLNEEGVLAPNMFHGGEMKLLVAEAKEKPEPGAGGDDFDTTPDDTVEPTCKTGEIWQIGEHRLAVGDCTNQALMDRLFNGQMAQMVFTDPQYNVDYGENMVDKTLLKRIQNDKMLPQAWKEFVQKWMDHILFVCQGAIYICMSDKELALCTQTFEKRGGHFSSYIIWVKDRFVMGMKDFHSRHETLIYGWPEGVKHEWYSDRTKDDVWEIPRPQKSEDHTTQKPLELVQRALEYSSKVGDIVHDPFGGSGTTLIECHRQNRVCYMSEIDPANCDVIIKRAIAEGIEPIQREEVGYDG